MERLQRIKELVEQKQQIDKEHLKDVVKAERAAFALKPPKSRKKKQGSLPLGVRISKAPAFGAFLLPVTRSESSILLKRGHQFDASQSPRIQLPQSSSTSRRTAAQVGFFDLSQSGERPER